MAIKRRIGVGALGLVCGALAGLAAAKGVGVLLLVTGGFSTISTLPVAMGLRIVPPAMTIVGVLVALGIDARRCRNPQR